MIESVSACGRACTADSTASRGRVTRRSTPRNMCSKSDVVGTPPESGRYSGINQELGPGRVSQPDRGSAAAVRQRRPGRGESARRVPPADDQLTECGSGGLYLGYADHREELLPRHLDREQQIEVDAGFGELAERS